MKILAISGSLRADSSNVLILRTLEGLMPQTVSFVIDEHIGMLPHFVPGDDVPAVVTSFFDAIAASDVVLFCTPEYAHGIPGVLKNALDWTVSRGCFYEKKVGLITASSQGEHGHAAMIEVLKVLTAELIDGAVLLVPFVRSKIDYEGRIKEDLTRELRLVAKSLAYPEGM